MVLLEVHIAGECKMFYHVLHDVKQITLRLTNMEVENHVFVEDSSLPSDHCPLPCDVFVRMYPPFGSLFSGLRPSSRHRPRSERE